jgi:hydrogenase maturation factor
MANVTIAGNSFVITSSISMADLETVKKYRPTALTLAEEETKEIYFKVGTGTTSSVNDHGISFSGVSNDAKKLATATLTIPLDSLEESNAKDYVLDKAGVALSNLNKIEAGITDALEDIKSERAEIAENITVSV